jgi:hypothetical protein
MLGSADCRLPSGARSHGPTTEEGKAKCGQSNVRHALLANTVLVTGESADEFDRLLNSQIRELEPQTEGELMLVEEMVHCKWNQMRIWAMTAVGLSDEIDAQRETAPEMLERSLPSRAFRAVAGWMIPLAIVCRRSVLGFGTRTCLGFENGLVAGLGSAYRWRSDRW